MKHYNLQLVFEAGFRNVNTETQTKFCLLALYLFFVIVFLIVNFKNTLTYRLDTFFKSWLANNLHRLTNINTFVKRVSHHSTYCTFCVLLFT